MCAPASRTRSICSRPAAEKGLELLSMDRPGGAAAGADRPSRLRQVLVNLVNNAVKFTDTGEIAVRVTVGPTPATLNFTVRDTGIGIRSTSRRNFSAPSVRSTNRARGATGGTGLGLVISRNLVRLMGGEISFVSAKGQGRPLTFQSKPSRWPERRLRRLCRRAARSRS